MSKPYRYTRFRWWSRVNLAQLVDELGEQFEVEEIVLPSSETEINVYEDEKEEIKIKGDTLTVYISNFRAVLNQREAAPFTRKDLTLKDKVFELYTHSRPTPFPWLIEVEPKFEVEG